MYNKILYFDYLRGLGGGGSLPRPFFGRGGGGNLLPDAFPFGRGGGGNFFLPGARGGGGRPAFLPGARGGGGRPAAFLRGGGGRDELFRAYRQSILVIT